MSPCPPHLRRFLPRKLGRGHAAALSAVVAAAFGLLGLRAVELPQPEPLGDRDRLRIEVVAPTEPKIVPGSVMEVGELVDGFQGLPPPPPVEELAWSYEAEWEEIGFEPPAPRRVAAIYVPLPPERRERPPRHEGRWFGFDAPRRDHQAERAARRARLEALDRREAEMRDAWRRGRGEWVESDPPWERSRRPDREPRYAVPRHLPVEPAPYVPPAGPDYPPRPW